HATLILPLTVELSRTLGTRSEDLQLVVVASYGDHVAAVRSPQPAHVAHLAVDHHATALHVDCLEATIPRAAQQQTVAGVLATQHGRKPVIVPRYQQIGASVAVEVLR